MKLKTKKLIFPLLACGLLLTACSQATSNQISTNSSLNSTSTASVGDYFTADDLDASYNEAAASKITLSGSSANVDGQGATVEGSTIKISSAGTYVISGESDGVQILVEAADSAKVQLVLDGVSMTGNHALIAATEAENLVITLADGKENSLIDAEHASDEYSAAIYSKVDLTFNGSGSLKVEGNYNNAIKGSDDVKFTGGTYDITSTVKHAISANDALNISNVSMTLNSAEDALHADHDEDTSLGNLYIHSGDITINAGDDAIHASNDLVIDGGNIDIQSSVEGIEGKNIYLNGGNIAVQASDDGINATDWSVTTDTLMTGAQEGVGVHISGGDINITMAEGDTDAVDSNGDLNITGGNITISAQSAFDFDGSVTFTGGTVTVNGEEWTEIVQTGPGAMGGGPGGGSGGPAGGDMPTW